MEYMQSNHAARSGATSCIKHTLRTGRICANVSKISIIMVTRDKQQHTFSLNFVENVSKNLAQKRDSLRKARKRTAAIQALMVIKKSDSDIKRDFQDAFVKVTHGAG